MNNPTTGLRHLITGKTVVSPLATNNRVDNHPLVSEQDAKKRWFELLAAAVHGGTLVKLTLSRPCSADASLENVFVRPVDLRAGRQLSFVFRHATRDITKNLSCDEGLARIDALLIAEFRAADLFATGQSARLEMRSGHKSRLALGQPRHDSARATGHDRAKKRLICPNQSPWLHALGVTTSEGKVRVGMEAKYRQLNKFVEILQSVLDRTAREPAAEISVGKDPEATSLTLVDMGCGKGYLTFAAYDLLRRDNRIELSVRGIEARFELVELCGRTARECEFDGLQFEAGTIETTSLVQVDVLVALHACDTATDDAIAKGVQAGAALI